VNSSTIGSDFYGALPPRTIKEFSYQWKRSLHWYEQLCSQL